MDSLDSDKNYDQVQELQERLRKQDEKITQFEKLACVYAELLMANHALEDRAVLLLGGLIEITKIKGSPPIQVARTIAQRCIDACKEQITAYEPTLTDEIHGVSGDNQGTSERQAEHLPNRAD